MQRCLIYIYICKVLQRIFDRDLNPERIIQELTAKSGQNIFKGDTLIFLDEIQVCEKALTSLKYFCENAPDYHIIAAGSLLGVAVNRQNYSFPVGKVEMETLYPLDFEEFLWALHGKDFPGLIRDAYKSNLKFSLHQMGLDNYRNYLVIGGMPAAVNEYMGKKDYNFVTSIQKTILNAYVADMAKYETPLDWLKASGVVNKCIKITEGKLPLSIFADYASFKVYMTDVGLLCQQFGVPVNTILLESNAYENFKGTLAENYVAGALTMSGNTLYYWESGGKAELDFVIQNKDGSIIPIEVKSSSNVRSKSLNEFVKRYKPPYSIKVSTKNFGFENNIKSVPLYAAFCIE